MSDKSANLGIIVPKWLKEELRQLAAPTKHTLSKYTAILLEELVEREKAERESAKGKVVRLPKPRGEAKEDRPA